MIISALGIYCMYLSTLSSLMCLFFLLVSAGKRHRVTFTNFGYLASALLRYLLFGVLAEQVNMIRCIMPACG